MRRDRTACTFSDSFRHRLNMYTLAASAAGVGMLVLPQSAEAKIIYTKTHKVITRAEQYNLDLSHDKITDFTVVNFLQTSGCQGSCDELLYLKPAAGNSEIGSVNNIRWRFAAAMNRGSAIGPKGHFLSGTGVMAVAWRSISSTTGPWRNVTNRYLGLKFQIKGKTHYGWARLNVAAGIGSITATLTGYAYETVPNKPIIAGKTSGPDVVTLEPASLGALAQGSAGLAPGRRKESTSSMRQRQFAEHQEDSYEAR